MDAPDNKFSDQDYAALDGLALQDMLLAADTVETFLAELVTAAARDTEHRCGITVRATAGASPYTVASSDEIARRLDEQQYDDRHGPCLEALETAVPVIVTDMRTESRWGSYPAHAVRIGARSSLSYPLISDNSAIGALNFYSSEPMSPRAGLQAHAASIAGLAAGALALALRLAERDELIGNLRAALTFRSDIDQAIGILMAQQRCTAEAAFDLLRTASQSRNAKVRDIAAGIVPASNGQCPSRGQDGTESTAAARLDWAETNGPVAPASIALGNLSRRLPRRRWEDDDAASQPAFERSPTECFPNS